MQHISMVQYRIVSVSLAANYSTVCILLVVLICSVFYKHAVKCLVKALERISFFICVPVVEDEEILKQSENRQEDAGSHNTAQFNQLGDPEDSHFYAYFMTMVVICIIGYLLFHNKQKVRKFENIIHVIL